MDRCCERCGLLYDDTQGVFVCPHLIAVSVAAVRPATSEEIVDELIQAELGDLIVYTIMGPLPKEA